jgi:predicted PurR-regulated permease PerM
MKKGNYDNQILIAITIAVALVSFFILKPYLNIILASMVVAYLSYPLYKWTLKWAKNDLFSASVTLIIIGLIIVVPIAFFISSVYTEAANASADLSKILPSENGLSLNCTTDDEGKLCGLITKIDDSVPYLNIDEKAKSLFVTLTEKVKEWSYKAAISLSTGIVNFFIMLFIVFFLLIDGQQMMEYLKSLARLRKKDEIKLTDTVRDTTYAVVYGNIVVALVQGAIAGVGYYLIAGMDNPILWALLTAFAALIPVIGTGIIWAPITLFMIGSGIFFEDYGTVTRGIILGFYCFFIVGLIDNIIKPKIIGDRSGVHSVIIMIGILGGLRLFGITGIIIGPVVLAVLITLLDQFISQKQKN